MTYKSVELPESFKTVLERVCPSVKSSEVQSGGISWTPKCAKEYLDGIEERNSYTTKVETSIASTIGPAAGIEVGLGLPFAFRFLKGFFSF